MPPTEPDTAIALIHVAHIFLWVAVIWIINRADYLSDLKKLNASLIAFFMVMMASWQSFSLTIEFAEESGSLQPVKDIVVAGYQYYVVWPYVAIFALILVFLVWEFFQLYALRLGKDSGKNDLLDNNIGRVR